MATASMAEKFDGDHGRYGGLNSPIAALQTIAGDRTPAGRRRLADAIGEFYVATGTDLSEREQVLAVDILLHILHDAEIEVRQALAERLADEPNAPHGLIVMLANDAIEIARPVLLRSLKLTDADLIAIARRQGDAHRIVVATRPRVSGPVGEALVETGGLAAIEALLHNPGAELTETALTRLIAAARRMPPLRRPLLSRAELTPDLAAHLYWSVSMELRRYILQRFTLPHRVLDAALEATIRELVDTTRLDAALTPEQGELVEHLGSDGAIRPALLIHTLRLGQIGLFTALFGRLAGLSTGTVTDMMAAPGGDALTIACRATGMEKGSFASIFLLSRAARPGEQIVDPRELTRMLALFDRVTVEGAGTVLESWRRAPEGVRAFAERRTGRGNA
jgi:uncharacterized protein (DUF2336 family)